MALTNDQAQALASYNQWLAGEEPMLSIAGFAGSGKTYLLDIIARNAAGRVAIAAPTHKALKVIRSKVGATPNVTFGTWHSLLGLRMTPDDDGYMGIRKDAKCPMREYDLVLGDESSMVNRKLFALIRENVSRWCRVVFLGDPAQLPPVKEESSPVYTSGVPTCFLREVVRQAEGSQILDLATATRSLIESGGRRVPAAVIEPFVLERPEWDEALWTREGAVALAFTRARVSELNRIIRHRRLGQRGNTLLPQYVAGETLVMQQPYRLDDETVFHTSEEVNIVQIQEGECMGYETWHMLLHGDGASVTAHSLKGSEATRFARGMRKEREAIRAIDSRMERRYAWEDYWEKFYSLAHVDYSYASTIHKAQGSQWENVFVDVQDCKKSTNRDFVRRLLYVAFTRAEKNLSLLF